LNSAITVINNNASGQTIQGQYTVDGVATGSTFQMTLPAGNGSTTLMSMPTQLSLTAGTTHTIGININDVSGLGISVKAGSTMSATAYNTSGGTASAVGAKLQSNPNSTISTSIGFNTDSGLALPVPASTNNTLWDAVASLMIRNQDAGAAALQAQFTINGTGIGSVFNLTLPATTNGYATIFMPQQFTPAQLPVGQNLGVQFIGIANSDFTLESASINLIAHQQVPTVVGTPEPASLSLAAMAALSFGAAAWRRRRSAKVPA
jgi:hypothetical protein